MLYLKFLKRNPGYDGKVSIYGHSLGSVLSYDILCHQENLSSPFPMEWMYKDKNRDEEPLPDVTNQPPKFNPLSNLEEKRIIGSHENEHTVDPIGEGEMGAQPTPLAPRDKTAEDSDITAKFSVTSDIKGGSAKPVDVEQQNCSSSSEADVHGRESSEKLADEVSEETDDKYKTIQLLSEEVASLKARIAELESQCAGSSRGNIGNQATQPNEPLPSDLLAQDDAPSYRPHIKYTKLEFKVDTFFAVGSPLGVFLALRNVRIGIGKGHEYWEEENISEEMPACRQMFNIFHPFDPVAYRIEPLVCKEYVGKRPVIIPYHRGGKRLHIGFQEFTEDLAVRSQAVMDRLNSVRNKVLTVCQSKNENCLEDATEKAQEREERSYGSIMMERLTGSEDGRIDHMLQDKTFQYAYISAIGSHTNYWRDYDTALFILKHLYRDVPEEPNSRKEEPNESTLKTETGHRDEADEELPLTFSDNVLRKGFSGKAKKILKKP